MFRYLSAFWGAAGIVAMLVLAICRISGTMLLAFNADITLVHYLALFVTVVFMAYSEGYKGFQQNFSPRVAARILYLSKEATLISGIFAPLFCMGYFGTTTRRQITSIAISCMLVALVILVREIPQPWRGIIDAGVVVGLLWGLISLLFYIGMAFRQTHFPFSPELPSHYLSQQD